MKRSRLIPIVLTAGLSSCICATSRALVGSCTFRPQLSPDSTARVYTCNGEEYAAINIDYTCPGEQEIGFFMTNTPELGHAVKIPMGRERQRKETYYFNLSSGRHERGIPDEVSVTSRQAPQVDLHLGSTPPHYNEAGNTLTISLPETHGADALIKYPLAAVLLIGVDIPCSLVGSVVNYFIIVADELCTQ